MKNDLDQLNLKERDFWKEYGRVYSNIEKSSPYQGLIKNFQNFLEPKDGDIWFDIGCGPLAVSKVIFKKNKLVKKIKAIDIVLEPAKKELEKLNKKGVSIPIDLEYGDISKPLSYPNECFDGVGANLVLSYVVSFGEKKGKEAFKEVLKEIKRVLKSGGQFIWSTPIKEVNFWRVFLGSIPDMLNIFEYIRGDITRISQGSKIMSHALRIQKKGKEKIYTFLSKEELEELLLEIGFTQIIWKKSFSQQAWIISCRKS